MSELESFLYEQYYFKHMLKDAERFFKVYAGLPIEERKNPIAVIDDEPINWNLAYEEIDNETERGEKILKILDKLKII